MQASNNCTDIFTELLIRDQFTNMPFTLDQLKALAEQFKKNGFQMTSTLAQELQQAARDYILLQNEQKKKLRLSEEKRTMRNSVTCLPS